MNIPIYAIPVLIPGIVMLFAFIHLLLFNYNPKHPYKRLKNDRYRIRKS